MAEAGWGSSTRIARVTLRKVEAGWGADTRAASDVKMRVTSELCSVRRNEGGSINGKGEVYPRKKVALK